MIFKKLYHRKVKSAFSPYLTSEFDWENLNDNDISEWEAFKRLVIPARMRIAQHDPQTLIELKKMLETVIEDTSTEDEKANSDKQIESSSK